MRHAREEDLAPLGALLHELRQISEIREKKTGLFYRGSRAFLHFHVHEDELHADVRLRDDFERFPMNSASDRRHLVNEIRRALG